MPHLFFEKARFNLMADCLGDKNEEIRKVASSYFQDDDVRNKIFPRLKLQGILACRKKAVNEFYGTSDYLDKYQPILSGEFTEPEYVSNLSDEELESMKEKQRKNELHGYLRIPRVTELDAVKSKFSDCLLPNVKVGRKFLKIFFDF